ncbi:Paternally-expressed 3 protein, partial [Dissostichus eleginoides]
VALLFLGGVGLGPGGTLPAFSQALQPSRPGAATQRTRHCNPADQACNPADQALQPSGPGTATQRIRPATQRTRHCNPADQACNPADQALQPSGPGLQPSGLGLQPSGPGLQPSGPGLQPNPADQACNPADQALQPSGPGLQPSGPGTATQRTRHCNPADQALQPRGPGTATQRTRPAQLRRQEVALSVTSFTYGSDQSPTAPSWNTANFRNRLQERRGSRITDIGWITKKKGGEEGWRRPGGGG